jgi:hypothetical protein
MIMITTGTGGAAVNSGTVAGYRTPWAMPAMTFPARESTAAVMAQNFFGDTGAPTLSRARKLDTFVTS